jgi:hypothetical protein
MIIVKNRQDHSVGGGNGIVGFLFGKAAVGCCIGQVIGLNPVDVATGRVPLLLGQAFCRLTQQ